MSGARALHMVAAGELMVGCRLVRLVRWLSTAEMMLLMASTLSWVSCRGCFGRSDCRASAYVGGG